MSGEEDCISKGYSCSHLVAETSRALVGSMPNARGDGIDARYVVIGKAYDPAECEDVCPNHLPKGGEVAVALDAGLIEQMYFVVKANQAREELILKERHKAAALRHRSPHT